VARPDPARPRHGKRRDLGVTAARAAKHDAAGRTDDAGAISGADRAGGVNIDSGDPSAADEMS